MEELDFSKPLPEAYFCLAFRALSGKRFRFLCILSLLRLALQRLKRRRVFNSREGGWWCSLYFSISTWSLALRLEIKSLSTFRTRIPVETKLSSIFSVPFLLQYTIAQIFVLYLNNKMTSCSLLSLQLLLLRCLLSEFLMASCQITRSLRCNK